MAKNNMLLGQARGKVGDLVFSRAYGKQIVRSKPASVKNPKSYGQKVQRAVLATISKAASALESIVNHSFAGITYGAESVRYFRKINMAHLRAQYLGVSTTFNLTAKGGAFVPNAYIISGGNLPSFATSVSAADHVIGFVQNESTELNEDVDITVGDFRKSYPYIQNGDQLTLVKVVKLDGELADGTASFAVVYDRIVLSDTILDDDNNIIIWGDGFFAHEALNLAKTTNPQMIYNVKSPAGSFLGCATEGVYAAALILSRKVNGKWQRSEQALAISEFDDIADNDAAVNSYGESQSLASSDKYLNQAEEGEEISGVSGSYMNVSAFSPVDAETLQVSVSAGNSNSLNVIGNDGASSFVRAAAYGTDANPVRTIELYDNEGAMVAHGAKNISQGLTIDGNSAGDWKVIALFADGTKATVSITVAVES